MSRIKDFLSDRVEAIRQIAAGDAFDCPAEDDLRELRRNVDDLLALMVEPPKEPPPSYGDALQEAHDFLNSLLSAEPDEATDFLTNNGEDVNDRIYAALIAAREPARPSPPIIVTVSGGVVQHVGPVPAGVIVEVRDYDCMDVSEFDPKTMTQDADNPGDYYESWQATNSAEPPAGMTSAQKCVHAPAGDCPSCGAELDPYSNRCPTCYEHV